MHITYLTIHTCYGAICHILHTPILGTLDTTRTSHTTYLTCLIPHAHHIPHNSHTPWSYRPHTTPTHTLHFTPYVPHTTCLTQHTPRTTHLIPHTFHTSYHGPTCTHHAQYICYTPCTQTYVLCTPHNSSTYITYHAHCTLHISHPHSLHTTYYMFHRPTHSASFPQTQIPGDGQERFSPSAVGSAVASSFAHWSPSTSLVLVMHGTVDSRPLSCEVAMVSCLPAPHTHIHARAAHLLRLWDLDSVPGQCDIAVKQMATNCVA